MELCNLAKLRHKNLVQFARVVHGPLHGEMLVVYDYSPGVQQQHAL